MSTNESLKKTRSKCDQIFVCSVNPPKNIWRKIRKSSKTAQEKKSLISSFVCFFFLLLPKLNLCKGKCALHCVSTQTLDFVKIFLLPNIPSLKSLRNYQVSLFS